MATTSAKRAGLCEENHLQAVKRQTSQQHQQGGLDSASGITYILWEGKSHNNINWEVQTLQGESLTSCGKAKVATTSAGRPVHCKGNHLHPIEI